MMKRFLFLASLALCLCVISKAAPGACTAGVIAEAAAQGATLPNGCYYSDYATGADTNSGTSEASPWKHIPGMLTSGDNCTGVCAGVTPSAGVGFILKGGVTWPATTMPLLWTWLGSGSTATTGCGGSGCIYIGIDPTWFTGRVNAVIPSQDMGGCSNGSVTATVTGGGGSGATVSVVMIGGRSDFDGGGFLVSDYTLTAPGSGYTSNPTVNVSGTGCNGVKAVADINRAVFDAGSGTPAWTDSQLNLGIVSGNKATNSIWDGIEIRNIGFNTLHAGNSPSIYKMIESPHVTAVNLYIHNWFTVEAHGTGGSDGSIALNLAFNSTNSSSLAIGNYVHNGQPTYTCLANAVCGYGTAIQAAAGSTVLSNVTNNHVSFANWAIRGCPLTINGNEIWGVIESDNGGHTNVFYATLCGAGSGFVNYVKNNRFHDNDAGAFTQITQTTNGVYWMYNNVCTQFCGNGSSFVIDPVTAAPTGTWTMNMFNNTFVVGTSDCMNVGSGGANYAGMALNMYNNVCATTQAGSLWYFATTTQPHSINGITSPTNTTPTPFNYVPLPATFLAASYAPANSVNPTSSGSPTQGSVFGGTNLTSFATGLASDLVTANAVPGAVSALTTQPATGNTWSAGPQIFAGGSPAAGTPTCSPVSGTFSVTQNPTCSVAGGAPVICYTTNGTTPATNGTSGCTTGTLYSGAIAISVTTTLKLIAGGTSFTDGPVQTYTYTINPVTTAPAAATFALNVLPLPLAPPIPIISSVSPASTYRGPLGFSQDGKTWATTLQLTLKGSNMTAFCTWANQPLNCTCNSPSLCFETLSMALVPVPSVATVMSGTMSPSATTIPVLN